MKIGLIGLAGSGKTTVFNAVTGLDATVGFTGDRSRPNLGVAKVPDHRLAPLTEMYQPKKVVPAEVTFVDLPGRIGAAGEGLDPQAVQHIRDMDGLALVIRAFDNPALAEATDASRDLAALEDELILTDLVVVERGVARLTKERKEPAQLAALKRCQAQLDEGRPLRLLELTPEEQKAVSGYGFLSQKPSLALYSAADGEAAAPADAKFTAEAEARELPILVLAGAVEMEISQLDPTDQTEFLADLGLESSARDRFVHAAWSLLDTICFLTVGPDEVRAWEIRRATAAVRAAGKVHSDIERGFIRAEVTRYEDLIEQGSEQACKEKGLMRLEGKDYPVQDGDVICYRFNV